MLNNFAIKTFYKIINIVAINKFQKKKKIFFFQQKWKAIS